MCRSSSSLRLAYRSGKLVSTIILSDSAYSKETLRDYRGLPDVMHQETVGWIPMHHDSWTIAQRCYGWRQNVGSTGGHFSGMGSIARKEKRVLRLAQDDAAEFIRRLVRGRW
jgi:hypothetical protein